MLRKITNFAKFSQKYENGNIRSHLTQTCFELAGNGSKTVLLSEFEIEKLGGVGFNFFENLLLRSILLSGSGCSVKRDGIGSGSSAQIGIVQGIQY